MAMPAPNAFAADRALRRGAGALAAVAAAYLVLYLVLAALRVPYPFELEWLEGSGVQVVARLLEGKPIYVRPSVEFASHFYTPFYYYVSAAAAWLVGIGFLPLRLVSLVAILGVFALLFTFARRETGSAACGLLAAGLFAATFRLGGAWFDVARVDSLFLLLTLAGVTVCRFGAARPGGAALAGFLFFLACFAKQSALLAAACMGAWMLLVDRRRGAAFLAAFAMPVALSTWILDRVYDGWYVYYTWDLPSQHPLLPQLVIPFWWNAILVPLPLAAGLAAWLLWRRLAERRAEALFHPAAAAGLLGVAFSSRLHFGSVNNVCMPAYASLALLFAIALHEALERLSARRLRPAALALLLLGAVQLAWVSYDPVPLVPTAADRAAGEALLARIRSFEGEVYLPFHGWLGRLAGKGSYATVSSVLDLKLTDDTELAAELVGSIEDAFRRRRFAAVFWDFGRVNFRELRANYRRLPGRLFDDPEVFRPVTGGRFRPETIFVPRPEQPSQSSPAPDAAPGGS